MCERLEKNSADEIEITPKMIEAGLSELYAFAPDGPSSGEEVVKDIFAAMISAASPSLRKKISILGISR